MSTCPIDILLSRGRITPAQHSAAVRFRSVRAAKFGSPHPKAIDLTRVSGPGDDRDTEEEEAQYREACDVLKKLSRQHFDEIENLAVYHRMPEWLTGSGGHKSQALTMQGLRALVKWEQGSNR